MRREIGAVAAPHLSFVITAQVGIYGQADKIAPAAARRQRLDFAKPDVLSF